MTRRAAAVSAVSFAAIVSLGRPGSAHERAPAPVPALRLFMTGKSKVLLAAAMRGAEERLSRPECRRVFDDFTDRDGRLLTSVLEETGQSASQFLAGLYYVEADDTIECRDGNLLAFTSPGSRVIHVCGARFTRWSLKPSVGERLVIHELLHALGLAENPPTAASITKAVMERCRADGFSGFAENL